MNHKRAFTNSAIQKLNNTERGKYDKKNPSLESTDQKRSLKIAPVTANVIKKNLLCRLGLTIKQDNIVIRNTTINASIGT